MPLDPKFLTGRASHAMPLASFGDDVDSEIDHEFVRDVVCPWCGNAQEDTDYCADQRYSGEEECFECGHKYAFEADFDITWCTRKIGEET